MNIYISYSCPIIRPGYILPCALVDHGLDCEGMAHFHESSCLIVRVVRNVGCAMKQFSNTVPTIGPHN